MGTKQTRGQRTSGRGAQGRERDRLVDAPPRLSCGLGVVCTQRHSSLLHLRTGLSTHSTFPLHPSKWWLWLPAGCLGEGHQEGGHREEAMTITKDGDGLLLVGIFVFSSCANKVSEAGRLTQWKFIISQIWRVEVHAPSVSKVGPR